MKKILLGLLVSILCTTVLCGCSKKIEVNLGRYATEDNLTKQSSVELKENNEFEFIINPILSNVPIGTYKTKGSKLILKVSDNEEYIFRIDDEKLILEEGNQASVFVKEGTEFFYVN